MDKKAEIQKCLKLITELSPEYQTAVVWVLEHFDTAIALCDAEEWTEEERAWLKEDARSKNDPLLYLFVELETILHSK